MTIGHSTGLFSGGDSWMKQLSDGERIQNLEQEVSSLRLQTATLRQDLTAMTESRDGWRTMVFALIDDAYRRRATDWASGYQAGVLDEHFLRTADGPRPAPAQNPHLLVQP